MKHGGDLSEAIAHYGGLFDDWLDLSTGINPEPWPIGPHLLTGAWHRLPSHADEEALLCAARDFYNVPTDMAIVAAPGTQALIQWLPQLARQGDTAIVGPTYSEHAHVFRHAGRSAIEISGTKTLPDSIRHLVIVNPNNPDGRVLDPAELKHLADEAKRRDGWLIADESFADIDPAIGCAALCTLHPVIVLRSFGKFFGLPGLRLGFLIAAPHIAKSFQAALGPWSVSTPALRIGAAALRDLAWAESTRDRLATMAKNLDSVVEMAGLKIVGGISLFRFVHHSNAKALHEKLARQQIWCRRFDDRDEYLRFGLPRTPQDLERLKDALLSS